MEIDAKHRFTHQDLWLFILGILGLVIFVALYGRLSPISTFNMKVSGEQAAAIAQDFLEQQGLSLAGYRRQVKLASDGGQAMHLARELGPFKANLVMRDSIPIYYWEVSWYRKEDLRVIAGGRDEEVKIPEMAIAARVNSRGNLFGFDFSAIQGDSQQTVALDESAALALARTFVTGKMRLDLSDFEPMEEGEIDHAGETDWNFGWEKNVPGLAGERIEVGVAVKDGRAVTYNVSYRIPQEREAVYERQSAMPEPFVVFLIMVWTGVGLIFIILFFIKAIRSELEFKLGLILGAGLAVVNVLAIVAALVQGNWGDVLEYFLKAIFIMIGASVIWAVCDSLVRTTWKEKLAVFDVLHRRRLLTIEYGQAALRGYAIAFICLGLLTLLAVVGTTSSLAWLTEKSLTDVHGSSFPFIRIIVDMLMAAVFLELFFRLFFVSYLRRRTRSAVLIVLVSGVVLGLSGMNLFGFAPTWYNAVVTCLVGSIFTMAFLRYELTTVMVGSFVLLVLWRAWPLLFTRDGSLVANGLAAAIVAAVPLVLTRRSLRRGESVDQIEEYIPPYMARAMEQERMKQELEIARRVQQSFLPRRNPNIAGLDIAAVCVPANEVGGDYYDFIPMGSHRVGLVIGDVSGKGVSAAFYMALMKGFLRAEAANLDSPKSILSKVNARFHENSDANVFISMVYGVLDAKEKTLTYARAGHNPVILHRTAEGTSQSFAPPGLALGLDGGDIFDRVIAEETIRLNHGDVLVFYTDGFNEASNWRKEEFGEERLLALIEKYKQRNAEGIISSIEEEIRAFIGQTAQWDDMTMVVAKIL